MLSLFIDAVGRSWTTCSGSRRIPGDRAALLAALKDPATRRFAEVNYGPWDRLAGNAPFVSGVGPKPDARRLLSARHVEGGIRARQPAGQPQRVHRVAARASRARSRSCRIRSTDARRSLRRGRGPARAAPPAWPRMPVCASTSNCAPRRCCTDDYPPERHGLARHEGQPARPRDRADRDLRGQAVRLQGRVRGLRPRQGHGVEQAAGEATRRCCRRCSADCRCRTPTRPRRRARTPTSTPTTSCTTPATATRARRPSPSTCRTTSRCSSPRARAACSSRTRCAPSSTTSWCRSRPS